MLPRAPFPATRSHPTVSFPKRVAAGAALGAGLLAVLAVSLAPPADAALTTERVASGLNRPVVCTAPPGDLDRLFIVEQRGVIRILTGGQVLATPFLDIDALVANISGNDERGLLGLAFHPDYATNGTFYLNYVNNLNDTVIARYTVSSDPDIADPASAQIILTIDQPYTNHNGGHLAFGPQDGYLYIGMGDGGSAGDPGNRAQNPGVLLGKMLRIDVDGGSPYAIPPDNPFVGPGDPLDEIWALGLRNPYRFAFDALTADLYIADVGQSAIEEVDYQLASSPGGENYGWRIMEGSQCYDNSTPPGCFDPSLTPPIHEYSHGGSPFRCSITGGVVYRGSLIPEIDGHYFFADFCSNQIWSFKVVGGAVTEFQDRTAELAPGGGLAIGSIAGFGADGSGEIYIVDRDATSAGEIYKIVPVTTGIEVAPAPAVGPRLGRALPNPFAIDAWFEVEPGAGGPVAVAIYGVDGRRVRQLAAVEAGSGRTVRRWDGRDDQGRLQPSGHYFVRAIQDGHHQTRRITLLR
jgi:glucose/arabinose dehydrogenase